MKEKIRNEVAERARNLKSREDTSSTIASKLSTLPEFRSADKILFYYSLPDEVDTTGILTRSIGEKTVYLPITNTETGEIEFGKVGSLDELQEGAYGIPEPQNKSKIEASHFQLIIVPGRAFDLKGNRLGRGRGYYDKLLARTSCPKVALAFEYQIIEAVPCEPHDIGVDKIITEERIIECSP